MNKTINTSAPTTLKNWIWQTPIRFAIFMAIITFTAFTIVALGGFLSKGTPTTLDIAPAIIIPIFGIFMTVKMLHRLDTTNVPMDRQSFITASTIMEIINRPINLIFGIIGIYFIAYFSSVSTPGIMSVIIPLIISLIMFYCLGVWICNMYLTYLRARTMGVSKLRAILSMPFSSMLWLAGYFIPDDSTPNTRAIASTNNTYNRIINWIMSRPANTALAYLIISITTFVMSSAIGLWVTIIQLTTFIVFVAIMGVGNLRKNIGNLYSAISVTINIVALLTIIGTFIAATQNTQQMMNIAPITQQQLSE